VKSSFLVDGRWGWLLPGLQLDWFGGGFFDMICSLLLPLSTRRVDGFIPLCNQHFVVVFLQP
jgi:hypothetical protein